MKAIGIVSCNKWKDKIKEDLLLKEAIIKRGLNAEIISWEDNSIDYKKFDCLILRSVWGYQNSYIEFKNWLNYLKENQITLYNSPDMILNNIRKDKQFQILKGNNIKLVDTKFLYNKEDLIKNINENKHTVIKPIISGSGERTYLTNISSNIEIINEANDVFSIPDNGIMMQPFIRDIENGEFACIFINGINTHNMIRFPGVFSKKQKPIYVRDVPSSVLDLAYQVASIDEYKGYLYMRVDIVLDNNIPTIMEVELAEPDLLFKYIGDDEMVNNGMNILTESIIRRVR